MDKSGEKYTTLWITFPTNFSMFIGEFSHSLDIKGRLAVPTKFKSELRKGAIVTRGLDASLWIFAQIQWEALAAKLAALPLSKSNSRAFARLMLAGAMDVKMDRQGRILIPQELSEYIGHEVVFVGNDDTVQIWNENNWNNYLNKERSTALRL